MTAHFNHPTVVAYSDGAVAGRGEEGSENTAALAVGSESAIATSHPCLINSSVTAAALPLTRRWAGAE